MKLTKMNDGTFTTIPKYHNILNNTAFKLLPSILNLNRTHTHTESYVIFPSFSKRQWNRFVFHLKL